MSDPVARLNAALEGRYAIERELGEGGMATVYFADDLKHERKVALKVLKPELAAVVGAERFLAEIKTTANLTHPNILPLHDSGEADTFLYYVMPFIEGESLRDRLDREHQLPVDEAVKITTDLAEALDYAHRNKVIHRDIKPANIMLHEGRPLIADFGIALAVGAAGGGRLTETGLSLGTPFYMSPEQATGDQFVGASTDTYALGSVLYEMLTGDPPYMGSTAQAVLGQIISSKHISATEKRASIPANVDSAIRKALEKLPADRFKSSQEFARALGDLAFRHGEAQAGRDGVKPRRRVLEVALIVAVGVALWGWLAPDQSQVVRHRLSFPIDVRVLDISPSGDRLAYVGRDEAGVERLWQREMNLLNASPIPGSESAKTLSFSPDGRQLAFVNSLNELLVVSFGGAPPVKIADLDVTDVTGGRVDWGPDENIYVESLTGLARVRSSGGVPPEQVTMLQSGENRHVFPHALPNGKGVLFTVRHGGDVSRNEIAVVDLDTGQHQILVSGVRALYAVTGHLIYATSEGTLEAARFDQDKLRMDGPPTVLFGGVEFGQFGSMQLAMSADGHLLYRSHSTNELAELFWIKRDGTAEPVESGWVETFRTVALSPDGTRLAVSISDRGEEHVSVRDLGGGPLLRLTTVGSLNWRPSWRPDGRAVGFISDQSGDLNAYVRSTVGGGAAVELAAGSQGIEEVLWSRDGAWLVFRKGGGLSGGTRDILRMRVGIDSVPDPMLATDAHERVPSLSPDGRWLVFMSDATGQDQIHVRPFPDGDEDWVVSRDGGVEPLWSPAGNEIFYRNADEQMVAVEVQTSPTFAALRRRTLFATDLYRRESNHRAY